MTTSDDPQENPSEIANGPAAAELASEDFFEADPEVLEQSQVPPGTTEVAAPTSDQARVDDLVGDLFRDVDDRFERLEQQYLEARSDFSSDTYDPALTQGDPVAASAARFELVEQIATLRADVERQAAELDERDRMLAELSERLLDFETRHRAAGEAADAAESLRQQLFDEHRQLTRVQALLDASIAEREELAGAAQRLQQDNEELESRLTHALARFDEVEQSRNSLADGVAQLEAAREAETGEHATRLEELHEARGELRELKEQLEELTMSRDEAAKRADRVEHDVERRANEVSYLNRRIESLSERAGESDDLEARVRELTGEQSLLNRRIGDLERELESKSAEAVASTRAVETLAERAAQHDELLLRVRELEASARSSSVRAAGVSPEPAGPASELQQLASRARTLGEQRSSSDYEPLGVEGLASRVDDDHDVVPAATTSAPTPPQIEVPQVSASAIAAPQVSVPQIEIPQVPAPTAAPEISIPQIEMPGTSAPHIAVPVIETPQRQAPGIEIPAHSELAEAPPSAVELSMLPPPPTFDDEIIAPPSPAPRATYGSGTSPTQTVDDDRTSRRRLVLPAEMDPETPQAVEYLLNQPRLTAVVDARSVCARAGLRPSDLFSHLERLRDRYDLPIEVVTTPVSTPVGGAPQLPAIGVHHVGGADTVADRVRALCMGFPADQQLVVIAGDDHVRRAAISQQANIVDPAIALGLA